MSPSSRTGNSEVPDIDELTPDTDVNDPDLYINRELSWLEFNQRVMAEAFDDRNPLLERVRFLSITAHNLDEFFMVRVSGLKQQVAAGVNTTTPDGMSAAEQLAYIDTRCRQMLDDSAKCFDDVLKPLLERERLAVRNWAELSDHDRAHLSDYFREIIYPVLTPLAVDPAHPFPYISNLSLSLAVTVRDPENFDDLFARVKVPNLLPRFVRLPASDETVPLEQLIAAHLEMLFPGMEIVEHHAFRVVRDADFEIEEDEAEDLLLEIEAGVRSRRFRSVVRLSVSPGMPTRIRELLMRELEVTPKDVFEVRGLLGHADLGDLLEVDRPDLVFPPWTPQPAPELVDSDGEPVDFFALMRNKDILLHHPYESFDSSVEQFIMQAVDDPNVLAIKSTLYRTTSESRLMRGLVRAAEAGKQIVAVVEIKARFDEERNIHWARQLEASGAHVAYGLVGLKTHCKAILVVRQEGDHIQRYVHIGTGNYNSTTARLYEDLGLLSTNPQLGADLTDLFNFLTGYSRQRKFRKIVAAPYSLRDGLTSRIDREIQHAKEGAEARIRIKDNSLLDAEMIAKMYEASQAGVRVDLVIRGICSIRPGVPKISENVTVRSIIGRFLEHSRIYAFDNNGKPEYLIGSADLMPRNLDRRVEVLAPVMDPELQDRLDAILERDLHDVRQGWILHSDGSWTRAIDSKEPGSQQLFMQEAIEASQRDD